MELARAQQTGARPSTVDAETPTLPQQNLRRLPPPCKHSGMPLMRAFEQRRSTRGFSKRKLDAQTLSDLLWAANGINREPDERTVPYWRHVMVLELYLAMEDGVWIYDAQNHALKKHLDADVRAKTGLQDFVGHAPLNLVYVVHGERMTELDLEERRLYGSVDAAFAGQNVYLYCASEGLATVFRGAVDQPGLGHALQLPRDQFVTFAQTVGYP
jgi:nitroreductase